MLVTMADQVTDVDATDAGIAGRIEEMVSPGQLLRPDGTLAPDAVAPLDEEFTIEAMRMMLTSRVFDDFATRKQRQGLFGVFSPVRGQEAAVVGSILNLDPKVDWMVPSYRELPALLHMGMPLDRIFANGMGKVDAGRIPDEVNLLPTAVALATQIQHAVGIAWGLKLQRKPGVVMVYFGEGASSEGDFHEACNLAGVTKAPVVFVLQNNQWAISTSRQEQTAAESFALRALGYGIAGRLVDGNDLFAVYEASRRAVQRAREGGGATLIECITYRQGFHNTTDNPTAYEDAELAAEARKKDPVDRLRAYLESLGVWDETKHQAAIAEITAEVEAAFERAMAMPGQTRDAMFAHVYANPPARVIRQRSEAE